MLFKMDFLKMTLCDLSVSYDHMLKLNDNIQGVCGDGWLS